MHEMGNKKLNTLLEEPDAKVYPTVYLSGPDALAVPNDAEPGDERAMKAMVHIKTVTKSANGEREVVLEIINAEVAPAPEPSSAAQFYPTMEK